MEGTLQYFRRSEHHARVLVSAAVAAAIGVSLPACTSSDPERSWQVPEALCGKAVPPRLLEPVLPDHGTKISLTPKSGGVGIERCLVSVDGEVALSASTEWWGKGTSVLKVASSQAGVKLDEHVTEDQQFTFADKGAVGKVDCPRPGVGSRKQNGELFATIFITDEGTPDEAAMKELIAAYAKAVTTSDECTAGQ